MATFNRARGIVPKSGAWLALAEPERACVALHVYGEGNKGELACLYVDSAHENQGIGRKLIQFVENKARDLGIEVEARPPAQHRAPMSR